MQASPAVAAAISTFYERFSSADPQQFARMLASGEGVSVIGSAPEEGHDGRGEWIDAYTNGIAAAGIKLRGGSPTGYEEGAMGFATDTPSFVLPDGSKLRTRLSAVLRQEDGDWKVVHLHFSVGVPDEQAMELAGTAAS